MHDCYVLSPPLPSIAHTRQTEHATTAIAILGHFGLESLAKELMADGVHNFGNLLSFDPNVQTKFDNLEL